LFIFQVASYCGNGLPEIDFLKINVYRGGGGRRGINN
jgi:hypothetical protein